MTSAKRKHRKGKVKVVNLIPGEGKATVVLEVEDPPPLPEEYGQVPPVEEQPAVVNEQPDHPVVKWFKGLIW